MNPRAFDLTLTVERDRTVALTRESRAAPFQIHDPDLPPRDLRILLQQREIPAGGVPF